MTILHEKLKQLTTEQRIEFERKLLQRTARLSKETKTEIIAQKNHSPAPLSFAQQRLWYLNRLDPEGSAYNMFVGFRVKDEIDINRLEKCLFALINRHESLRTIFRLQNNKPVQVVIPPQPYSVELIDLTHETPARKSEMLVKLAEHIYRRPFELDEWPLFRIAIARLAEEDHVEILAMHHIITDAWSMDVFFREISQLYKVNAKEELTQLPILPVQYADYAIWQETWMQSAKFAEDMTYWKNKLEGQLPILNLPTDQGRSMNRTSRGRHEEAVLGAADLTRLRSLAAANQASVNMAFLTVFKVLLSRLSGQTDIIVGSPAAGRNVAELENLIGFFINTLVLRTDLSGDPTFLGALARIRQTSLDAFTHQEFPFEKVVESLAPERDLGRTPLFQVFFNYIRAEARNYSSGYFPVEEFNNFQFESKFDITLYVLEEEKHIRLTLAYNGVLFKKLRMVEFLHQYCFILRQILDNPQIKINAISLVTPSVASILPNAQELLPVLGREQHPLGRLLYHAQQTPAKTAIEYGSNVLNYGQLEQYVNYLAKKLKEQGILQGEVIAVIGERSMDFVCALLAIMKVGAVFSIMDPAYPSYRLMQYMNELRPRFLMPIGAGKQTVDKVTQHIRLSYTANELKIVHHKSYPDMLEDSASQNETRNHATNQDPDDLAYILFTSGTTDIPKAIGSSMRPLCHFLSWYEDNFSITADDRFSFLSGLSHDPSLRDVLAPLWSGATLCIPSSRDVSGGERLNSWLASSHISVMHLTPAMGMKLAGTSAGIGKASEGRLKSLRYLFFGGEALTTRHVRLAHQVAPRSQIVNFYGATETPQAMGFHCLTKTDLAASQKSVDRAVSIGRGIEDVQLLVVNREGRMAGVGEIGEIWIRTPYLSKGYLNDAGATREAFITNPLSGLADDWIYRTGDLGRYSCDGLVEFVGRSDRQLNINGFRIEPGTIESCLRQHPAVAEVMVTAKQYGEVKHLVAFIRKDYETVVEENELKKYVLNRLPTYLVPTRIIIMNDFPLTANGKIDHFRLLQSLDPVRNVNGSNAPRTKMERLMAELWKETLKIDDISTVDNFFEIGGHSLLSMELIAAIEQRTGIVINPREFMYQTLGQLAVVVERRVKEQRISGLETKGYTFWDRIKNKISFINQA